MLVADNIGIDGFPISRDPPEGGTPRRRYRRNIFSLGFPISRDPPEGGTSYTSCINPMSFGKFPISRDPPEGGTRNLLPRDRDHNHRFQFLGIPPKGEPGTYFKMG